MDETSSHDKGIGPLALLARWQQLPLYIRILIALAVGVIAGVALGPRAAVLTFPARLILRLLGALAPPLILFAILQSLLTTKIGAGTTFRLARLLLLNTTVAILIGLLVANALQPGRRAHLTLPTASKTAEPTANALTQILDSVPDSLWRPLVENNVLGIILIAVAFGLALRRETGRGRQLAEDLTALGYRCILRVLHWVIALVPLGVFGIVAGIIGTKGFAPFVALGAFVIAVLIGLVLQAIWYLVRIRFGSWVSPWRVIRGTRDALLMAFSTDSSTATMPVTYANLVEKVALREQSASLGALVGTNFNNDGTALYEAMSALFVGQLIGHHLSLVQQLMVVLTSIAASVGAAGIPEAGLVTMTLVFTAVGLPTEYIAILLTVDWFLDRSRTVVNVMGDINVSCLLDGREPREGVGLVRGTGVSPARAAPDIVSAASSA